MNSEQDNEPIISGGGQAQSVIELVARGWEHYGRKEFEQAVQAYQAALSLDSRAVDIHYALGMALKYDSRINEAIKEFNQAANLAATLEDTTRGMMISRLARGHIKQMQNGDWGLSEDLWKKR